MSDSPLQYHLPLIILGTGYTGRRIYLQARQAGWKTFATSRNPDVHLANIPVEHRLLFDLARRETWAAIPAPAHLIWCFPATPLHLVQAFFGARPKTFGRIVVLGSTSAYQTTGGVVTEQSPLNLHLPRVQGEELLRQEHGAVVIRLAGLYGPGRNVLDWIRKGKIRNNPKWVNLLHVEDAAGICLQAFERAQEGVTYLASDGQPRTWADIVKTASVKWQVPAPPLAALQDKGKQIVIHQLLADLHYRFRFPDLYQALEQIEEPRSA